ncbi:uncharacterized protein LOC135372766 [Ornithodoros turicata]|uniref:uncharacterized protein LOC135372766 n=1 Tax=Ornithodoros turicata TaxID=34597 RepID=UPI00313921C7
MADDVIDDAVAAIFLIFALEDEVSAPQRRREWSRQWLLRRKRLGCYENLLRELSLEDTATYRRWLRMDINTFELLLAKVGPLIRRLDTPFREAIHPGERLAITLRYLATGETQSSLEGNFRVARNTISMIIADVCKAIYKALREDYVMVPKTQEEWCGVANRFQELWQFPNCCGALDGKHVVIRPPPNSGALYHNYKGSFSIILMALVDADMRFIYVDVGRNGRMNDSGVWGSCDLRLSRARRIVENAFGVLSNRWRVCQSPLRHSPDRAGNIVLATVALHNFLRTVQATLPLYTPAEMVDVEDVATGTIREAAWRQDHQPRGVVRIRQRGFSNSRQAKEIRELYTNYFINEGAVSWQWQHS